MTLKVGQVWIQGR